MFRNVFYTVVSNTSSLLGICKIGRPPFPFSSRLRSSYLCLNDAMLQKKLVRNTGIGPTEKPAGNRASNKYGDYAVQVRPRHMVAIMDTNLRLCR